MISRHWKMIAVVTLIEALVIAGSVALGIYIGKQLAADDRNAARQADGNTNRSDTRTTRDSPALNHPAQNVPEQRRGSSSQPIVQAGNDRVDRAGPQQANQTASPAATPETVESLRNLPTAYFIIAGGLALILLLLVLYFLAYLPRKRRRPMLQAFALINRGETTDFPDAERLLAEALTGGMRKKEIADARFALAYVRARLGRYPEAAAVLADLIASGHRDREITYLELWLLSRLKDDEKIVRTYEQHATMLGDLIDVKLIAGIAYLHRAQFHWTHREVGSALHYYEQLTKLGVLTEEIPSHIDDHEVLIGIMSLFDKNIEEAEKHFKGAVAAAGDNAKSTTYGELGLLLCQWRATDTPYIDVELGAVVARLTTDQHRELASTNTACKFCDQKFTVRLSYVGQPVGCTSCKRRFIVSLPAQENGANKKDEETKAELQRLLTDDDLLLRNVLLWHAVARLFTWRSLPAGKGLPESEYETLNARLAKIREIDPVMPDADLLAGLISYYFAGNEQAREQAVELLDKSSGNGVNVPEVLDLIEREQRLAKLSRDSLNRYFALVRNYLTDKGVPERFRKKLKEQLERFSRFKQLGETDLLKGEAEALPSLGDVQSRGTLLCKRVDSIVKPRLVQADEKDREAIEGLLRRLTRTTKTLSHKVSTLEETECLLMEATGEFLLQEEEEPEQTNGDPDGSSVNGKESEQAEATAKA